MKKLKIAIVATNLFPTPPIKEKVIYAPLWIAHYTINGLIEKGHKVYLAGASNSQTKATLISNKTPFKKNTSYQKPFKKLKSIKKKKDSRFLSARVWQQILKSQYELSMASEVIKAANQGQFDIIQFHAPYRLMHIAGAVNIPCVWTIHDPISHPFDTKSVSAIFENAPKNLHFVSISKEQRKPNPKLNYAATIYNGIDLNKFSFKEKKEDYLLFAGRIIEKKGAHIAINVAKKTNMKLKIAGYIPPSASQYFTKKIKPHLSHQITYEGMLSQTQIAKLYQGAKAFLMPILVRESFGLVMAEAMACGTPVVAFNKGSVPEVVKHKKTGFVVKTEKEMIEAVKKIDTIKRIDCRKHVEDNFSLQSMIDNYEKLYQELA